MRLNTADLTRFGDAFLRNLRDESLRDSGKRNAKPFPPEFFASFSFTVTPNVGLVITSTYPWIGVLMEGSKGPFRMSWLTRENGVSTVPMVDRNGTVVFRATPLTSDRAWVHPGIARHTFVQRALERAEREILAPLVAREIARIIGGA